MHTDDIQTLSRELYEAPRAEVIEHHNPLSLLMTLSADTLFEDFEEGEDLDFI